MKTQQKDKKETQLEKLKKENKQLEKTIRVISNTEIVHGLKSAMEDFKKGRYTIIAK